MALTSIDVVRVELDRAEAGLTERLEVLRRKRDGAQAQLSTTREERDAALAKLEVVAADLRVTRVYMHDAIKERNAALAELAKMRDARASAIADWVMGPALRPSPPVTRQELADALTRRLTTDRHRLNCRCERCRADRDLLDRVAAELGRE